MTNNKPPKKPIRRGKPRRAPPPAHSGVPSRDDFSAIIDMIADARERGAFDPKTRRRTVAKPTVANTPGAPFARIVAGAKTEDQQLRALEAAAQSEVALPADPFVAGEPITAAAITCSGHPRAGLTLWGVRGDLRFSVGLADVAFPPGSAGARFVSLYRAWLGFGELSSDPDLGSAPAARHKVTSDDIAVGSPVELIVLACKSNALRCRLLFDSDPIVDASEPNAAGDRAGAREVLMKLLAHDLRCLDAHAHPSNFPFDRSPMEAQRHYEIGTW